MAMGQSQAAAPALAGSKRRISTIVMVASAALMVISMFLPYIVSKTVSSVSVSVIGAVTAESELIPSDSKTLYTIIAGSLGVALLFAGLSLTGRKLWGVLSLILSLLILAFHGLLLLGLSAEDRSAGFGIGAWLIMLGAAVLLGSSIAFMAGKKRA